MLFEFKGNALYSVVKKLQKTTLKNDAVAIYSESKSLKFIVFNENSRRILDLSSQELDQIQYHCSGKGVVTTKADLLLGFLSCCQTEKKYYIAHEDDNIIAIRDIDGEGVCYSMPIDNDEAICKLSLPIQSMTLNRVALYEGLKRFSRAKISDRCNFATEKDKFIIDAENSNSTAQYQLAILSSNMLNDIRLSMSLRAISSIKKIISGIKTSDVVLYLGNSKLFIEVGDYIGEYECLFEEVCIKQTQVNTIYNCQLKTMLKEWCLVHKDKKNEIDITDILINYQKGFYEYKTGKHRNRIRTPINFDYNTKYNSIGKLSSFCLEFSCLSHLLKVMSKIGNPSEYITMYFSVDEYGVSNNIMIKYSLSPKYKAFLTYVFKADE